MLAEFPYGIHWDTDFIILKDLRDLTIVLHIQSQYSLCGAFLAFRHQHKAVDSTVHTQLHGPHQWLSLESPRPIATHASRQEVVLLLARWLSRQRH